MIPTDSMVDKFLAWKLPPSVCADQCATVQNYAGHRTGTNLLTADEAYEMLEHVLEDPDRDGFEWEHDAAVLFERAAHHLAQMMQAYERRVRSDCTPEQIEKRSWECAEYVAAARFLRRSWRDAPAVGPFVGTAWLIELDDPLGRVHYYCGPGDWCDNPNHAAKFTHEEAARNSSHWRDMHHQGNMRIAEHEWVAR